MSQIEKLSPEQEEQLINYRNKWLAVGLSTEKTNRAESERAVRDAYKIAGLNPPRIFIWLRSPLEGAIASYFLTKLSSDQVRAQVGDQVWDQVRDQVRAQVWDQVWAQVRAQVRAQVGDQVGDQLWKAGYGLHDAFWLGFVDFFMQVVQLDCAKKLEPLMRLAEHCGWWWPFQGAVIMTEKPVYLSRDAENRLHADGRKAIEYADGFGIYSFRGVRVGEKLGSIRSEEWKSEWILKEKNAEIRRVLIQGVGYAKMARDLNAKTVDTWKEYELLRIDKIDVEPVVMIKMTCPSTGLLHAHRVPPEMTSCREAIKWCNWGIDKEEFLVER